MCAAPLPAPDEIEAVVFDLDDTLVDARGAWRASFAEAIAPLHAHSPALQRLGEPPLIYDSHFRGYSESAHRSAGSGEWEDRFTLEAFERLLAEHLGSDASSAAALCGAYREAIPRHQRLYPDALATLEAVGSRYPLGLVSNGPRGQQRAKVERMGLEGYFETVVISGEVGIRKPDPAIFRLALEALAVSAMGSVYVGDDPRHDVIGACDCGLAAIWVNRGDFSAEVLSRDGKPPPRHVEVRSLTEVPSALGLA